MQKRIVFLDAQSIAPEIQWPKLSFEHLYQAYPNTLPEQIPARIKDADIVISNKVPLGLEQLRQAPRLKHIAIPATGYNHIDLTACTQAQISVSNIRDYAEVTVPEHCLAMIFALQRSLVPYHKSVARGRWQESGMFCYHDYPITQVQGSTLGIIGAGTLGRALAHKAQALGMQVLFAERKGATNIRPGYTAFEELLAQSDVISLHCPLTEDTFHLLDRTAFQHMHRHPVLLNTSRGALIEVPALVEALDNGQIRAAGIDVVEEEPPAADHPFMALLDRPNVIMTPHVAWANRTAMQRLVEPLVANSEAFVHGAPINLVL